MNSKSLRSIAVMGLLAVMAMTGMMFFSLDTVTESSGMKIAKRVHSMYARSLDPDAGPTRISIRKLGDEGQSVRHCTLTIWPSAAVARSDETLERLAARVAEEVIVQMNSYKGDITVTAVLVLPDGSERRRSYDRSLRLVEPPPETERAAREQAAAR